MFKNTLSVNLLIFALLFVAIISWQTPAEAGVVSTDNTWTGSGPFATGLGNRAITALAVDPTNPDVVYAGTGSGTVFRYLHARPVVTTDAASGIATSGATLNSTVNAKGADTTVTFEYGQTTSYGTTVTASPDPVTGASDISVSAAIGGLTPGATYHFRAIGTSTAGTIYGDDITFTTQKAETTTSITSHTPDPSVTGSPVAVGFTVTSAGGTPTGNVTVSDGTVSCKDTVAAGNCSLTPSSAGSKTLTATYEGDSSFKGSTASGVSHTVDTYISSMTCAGSSPTNASSIMWTVKFADPVTGVSSLNFSLLSSGVTGGSISGVSGSGNTWSVTADTGTGDGTITLKMTDSTGTSPSVSGLPFTGETYSIDKTAPALKVSTLSDGSWTANNPLNISGDASDNGSGLQGLTINGDAVTVNPDDTYSYAFVLAEGANVITIVAADKVGNKTTDSRTINFDPAAPVITIDQPVDNSKTKNPSAMISGFVDDYSSVTAVTNNLTPVTFSFNEADGTFSATAPLIYGTNTLEVSAEDLAHNTATGKRTVTFDTLAPELAITEPSQDISTSEPNLTVRGEVTDLTIVGVTLSIDNGAPEILTVTNGSFQRTVTFTEEKTYGIKITAQDEVGNTSSVTRNIIHFFDTIPETFTFTDQTNVPVNSARISNTIKVSGTNGAAIISISSCSSALCEYSVSGTDYTSAAGTVNNGDTVTVRQTSSSNFSTTTSLTLNISGVTDTFSVTTMAMPNGPDLTGSWTSLYLTAKIKVMKILSGTLRIRNIGNRDAGTFKVAFYLSEDGRKLGPQLTIPNVTTVKGLSSGAAKDITNHVFQLHLRSSPLWNYVIAVIDSAGQVVETNENNNLAVGIIP